jgi:hypothetical protein
METVAAAFILALGAWTAQFNEDAQVLTLTHAESAIELSGELSFVVGDQAWRVCLPRDGVNTRLALVDVNNETQGYLAFNTQGDRLDALVYHRTRQFYNGTLTYRGQVSFREESFPCRTYPQAGERVLSLVSGKADSSSFDSLFAREEDLALRFTAANFLIANTQTPGKYQFEASGRIEEASEASFAVELDKNYFQKRWVPHYSPIDRERCPTAPTGWLSWNTYFDTATAEDNLAEARIGKEFLQPFGCEIWNIESWQGNSDRLPVSGFYNLGLEVNEKQFPKGMKQLADDIRALGFKPGLWTAPFGTGSKEFYEAHKDWFLHDENGVPMRTWNGVYTIDPSNDKVIDWIRHIHDVFSHEWGYEFFKIDGRSGSGGGYCAHFFERPEVRAAFKDPTVVAPFERCVKAFREGIGEDRIFLACQGHFTGPEAMYADAARTGADIVHPNQPVKWANLVQQAGRTLNQVFVNNIVFFSDPDNLLVNEALTIEEARVTTTVVALPGQLTFFGDKLGELPPERMRLLQQTLPVCDVHPGALYPYFSYLPVWDLKIGRDFGTWDVVALFNWTEEDATIGADLAELGLPPGQYCAYEFWTNQYLGEIDARVEMAVPAHAVRLLAVHRVQDRPQFLSSDRHVSQGGVDLKDLSWNEDAKRLEAKVTLVAKNKTTLRFRVPEGFQFSKAESNADVDAALEADGKVLAVGVQAEESGDYDVVATF